MLGRVQEAAAFTMADGNLARKQHAEYGGSERKLTDEERRGLTEVFGEPNRKARVQLLGQFDVVQVKALLEENGTDVVDLVLASECCCHLFGGVAEELNKNTDAAGDSALP